MEWFFQNWHEHMAGPQANILLALISVICGSIIGAERERKEKPAGVRTLTLVSLGAAVFTMVSIGVNPNQPSYVAAQVVTGVGFLGAGAILRANGTVMGITTAATIWVAAATGMAVGAGYPLAGLGLSVMVLLILTVIGTWEHDYLASCRFATAIVTFDPVGGKTIIKIEELLEEFRAQHSPAEAAGPEGRQKLKVKYCKAHRRHREFLVQLAEMPEVREIRLEEEKVGD